jgi:hypothetical protein
MLPGSDPVGPPDDSDIWPASRATELPGIPAYKGRPPARVGRLVRVSAIVGTVSVLLVLFAQTPAGRALVNGARLVSSPISERRPDPPIEPHSLSVVEAPAPSRPAPVPTERSGRPRDTGRARTEVVKSATETRTPADKPGARRSGATGIGTDAAV